MAEEKIKVKGKGQNPNSRANLVQFRKGVSGNPKGRPKAQNRVTDLHKRLGVLKRSKDLTKEELDSIEKAMLALPLSDLQLLAKDDSVSALEKTYAMAIIIDMKNGRTTTMDKLRERQYGKTVQQVDITSNGETIGQQEHQTMTPEEAKAFLAKIEMKF